jgi:hypothetical protein
LWNGGGDAAAARVRRLRAVGALLRLELLVLLVQAKRTKKKLFNRGLEICGNLWEKF